MVTISSALLKSSMLIVESEKYDAWRHSATHVEWRHQNHSQRCGTGLHRTLPAWHNVTDETKAIDIEVGLI